MSDPPSEEPISWFPVPDEADLPADLQKLFAKTGTSRQPELLQLLARSTAPLRAG